MSTSNQYQVGYLDPKVLADLANQNFSDTQPTPTALGDSRGRLPSGVASHSFQPLAGLDIGALAQLALGGVQQQAGHDLLAQNPSSLSLGRSFGAEQFIPNSLLSGLANPGNDQLFNQLFPDQIPVAKTGNTGFDPLLIRKDFPILSERVNGRQLIWFDNAATTQKPKSVIDRITIFMNMKIPIFIELLMN